MSLRKEAQKKGKKKLRGDNERVRNGKNVCKLSFEIVTRQMAPRCQDLLAKSNFQASMASKIALYARLSVITFLFVFFEIFLKLFNLFRDIS